jgi:hypothetical protein
VNVRADGLAPVLGRLLRDPRIRSAALVDVDSGMVLDSCTSDQAGPDPEVQGAGHADMVRVTLGVLPGPREQRGRCEVVIDDGTGMHHVLRVVPDAHGGLLALTVVVTGPDRVVARVRRRLRRVSSAALTAGPSTVRRPSAAQWVLGLAPLPAAPATVGQATVEPDRAIPGAPRPARNGARGRPAGGPPVAGRAPAPPSAIPPGPRRGG